MTYWLVCGHRRATFNALDHIVGPLTEWPDRLVLLIVFVAWPNGQRLVRRHCPVDFIAGCLAVWPEAGRASFRCAVG